MREAGFTLIEMMAVTLIIGVLAALALPQYFKIVEKSKVQEALSAFNAARGAQERYKAKYGVYCIGALASCGGFDVQFPLFRYFNPLTFFSAGSGFPSWKASLQRTPPGSSFYGAYTLNYDVEPSAPPTVTCAGGANPAACGTDLLTQIQ